MKYFWLENQIWQTEWKTASLVKVQVCEYENQTLEVFVAVSRLSAEFDCPVAHQNISFIATAHCCETGLQCFAKVTFSLKLLA